MEVQQMAATWKDWLSRKINICTDGIISGITEEIPSQNSSFIFPTLNTFPI